MKINNNITETLCSFELSKLLKEKGYLVSPDAHYFTENGGNGICSLGSKLWEDIKDGKGTEIIRPTHSLAILWVQINLNCHLQLIWKIENRETVWYYTLSQIGDLKNDVIETPKYKSQDEATEAALLKVLGQEPVEKGIDYDSLKDKIVNEYASGNVIVATFEGLQVMPLVEFIKQPVDGLLYDLNRTEAVVLTFIKDPKWVNDYAVCKVIRELKKQLEEKEKVA